MDWIFYYRIDRDDRICAVSDAWVAFALANQGQQLLPPAILGRELWQMVGDLTTRYVYQVLLRNVRSGRGPVRFQFRCDAPAQRRLLSMHMSARDNGEVQFETTVVRDQPRVSLPVLEPQVPRAGDALRMCGWCMRVPLTDGSWVELEDGLRELKLFEQPLPPPLTHGMCAGCYDAMMAELDSDLVGATPVVLGNLP